MAWRPEEEVRRKRRKRLLRGALVAGAAVGLPALLNAWIARSARRIEPPAWGEIRSWAWRRGAVAYRRLGDGRPVVLVHALGPGFEGTQWRGVAEALASSREVFVPDLLGWGSSEMPAIRYTAGLYTEQLADFVREVVREPATVIGAGLAGAFALRLAVEAPELVLALGLVAPSGLEVSGERSAPGEAVVHGLLRLPVFGTSALNLYASRAAIAHYLQRDLFFDPQLATPECIDEHYLAAHRPGARRALAAFLAGRLDDAVAGLASRVEAPVWIGWGRESTSPPVEEADLWLRALPAARLDVFEGAGALPHYESPSIVAEALEDFFAERATASPA